MKTFAQIFLAVIAVIFLAFALPWGCTHPNDTIRTLNAAGYRNVEITGWRPFAKSKDDWYSTGFRATAPNGTPVTGVVTGGLLFKGNTIRTD